MKEYKIQMHRNGVWRSAMTYWGGHVSTFTSLEAAGQTLGSVRLAWEEKKPGDMPDDFRILERTVSEWTPLT